MSKHGLPRHACSYAKLPLDVHLMVDKPVDYLEQTVVAGASYVCFHLEVNRNTVSSVEKDPRTGL